MAEMNLSNFWRFSKCGLMLAVVSGCAASTGSDPGVLSTGILPAGPDTYTITERYWPVRGGAFIAQESTLRQGNAYCATQNKQFMALDKKTLAGMETPVDTGYSLTFRCVDAGTKLPLPTEVVEHEYKP